MAPDGVDGEDLEDDDFDDEDFDDEDEDFDEDDEDFDDGEEADYEPGDVNTVAPGVPREPAGQVGPASETSLEVLTYLARSMADDPDSVVVRRESRRGSTVLRLHVAPTDMGRVIGRRGRTAQAIRTLVGAAGARDGVQTLVDIADD